MSENKKVKFDTSWKKSPETYANPLIRSYDEGDPFVLRYDGKYYLYPSTHEDQPGSVQVSEDLVNWSDRMICTPTEDISSGINEGGRQSKICLARYAPEVTYFNGKFYMVTALGGHIPGMGGLGHQFFVSDKPTGPFKMVGKPWGCRIDGHIFIDNDGKWYFYSANAGLHGFKMTSPTELDLSSEQEVGVVIDEGNGTWTEGPMVVYHDGTYFLSYTGNHVCHSAYRIAYGVSKDNPLKFETREPNPLLVSTTDVTSGIGHSSSVKGPDLDTYYIAYHTRIHQRYFNIDRLVFNGQKMDVFGPTVKNCPVPPMPELYAQFDYEREGKDFEGEFRIEGGKLVTEKAGKIFAKKELSKDFFTAELTVSRIGRGMRRNPEANEGKAGLIFAYSDENSYGEALFDTVNEALVIRFVVNGEKTEYSHPLVRSFDMPYDFTVTQAMQVEKSGDTFTFYVNDRLLCSHTSTLSGRKFGMVCEDNCAQFGYFGVSAAVGGSSSKEFPKPIATQTGYIQADLCKEYDIKTGIIAESEEKFITVSAGESTNYALYTEESGLYGLSVTYRSAVGAELEIYADEKYIKSVTLPASSDFSSVTVRDIPFGDGEVTLTVYVAKGEADILYYRCMKNTSASDELILSYTDGIGYTEENGETKMSGFAKRLYGSYMLGDYKFSVNITPSSEEKFGLLARTQNPGAALFTHVNYDEKGAARGAREGRDWMQGYYFEFENGNVNLYKCCYRKTLLASAKASLTAEKAYRAEIVCEGSVITLLIDGEKILSYTDANPYINGMAGVKTEGEGAMTYSALKISTLD